MEYIVDGYGKRREASRIKCDFCGIEFLKANRFIKENKGNFCCNSHSVQFRKKRITLICAYCGTEFERRIKDLKRSKSKIYFCTRACKDTAQKIENGFKQIWPDHYGETGCWNYREQSFGYYEKKCENCGYDEHIEILEVHHIDGNRENNNKENLEILCPNCHTPLTRGYATLINRKIIWKNRGGVMKLGS